jgi:hypothetical protein
MRLNSVPGNYISVGLNNDGYESWGYLYYILDGVIFNGTHHTPPIISQPLPTVVDFNQYGEQFVGGFIIDKLQLDMSDRTISSLSGKPVTGLYLPDTNMLVNTAIRALGHNLYALSNIKLTFTMFVGYTQETKDEMSGVDISSAIQHTINLTGSDYAQMCYEQSTEDNEMQNGYYFEGLEVMRVIDITDNQIVVALDRLDFEDARLDFLINGADFNINFALVNDMVDPLTGLTGGNYNVDNDNINVMAVSSELIMDDVANNIVYLRLYDTLGLLSNLNIHSSVDIFNSTVTTDEISFNCKSANDYKLIAQMIDDDFSGYVLNGSDSNWTTRIRLSIMTYDIAPSLRNQIDEFTQLFTLSSYDPLPTSDEISSIVNNYTTVNNNNNNYYYTTNTDSSSSESYDAIIRNIALDNLLRRYNNNLRW